MIKNNSGDILSGGIYKDEFFISIDSRPDNQGWSKSQGIFLNKKQLEEFIIFLQKLKTKEASGG